MGQPQISRYPELCGGFRNLRDDRSRNVTGKAGQFKALAEPGFAGGAGVGAAGVPVLVLAAPPASCKAAIVSGPATPLA